MEGVKTTQSSDFVTFQIPYINSTLLREAPLLEYTKHVQKYACLPSAIYYFSCTLQTQLQNVTIHQMLQ